MNKRDRREQFQKNNAKSKGDITNARTEKSRLSKKQIEKKARAQQATKRSVKTVSEIVLNSEEEDRLLNLIADLQKVSLVDQLPTAIELASRESVSKDKESGDDENNESEEDDNEDENEEQIVKSLSESDSDTDVEDKADINNSRVHSNGARVMTKEAFIRKLIRDDRRERKALSEGNSLTSEKMAAKIRNTMNSKTGASSTVSSSSANAQSIASSSVASSSSTSATVRMVVDCPKKGGKGKPTGKILVFSRLSPLSDIVDQVRMKFNAGNKYNSLKIVSTNKIMDDFDLMTLADGELVHLLMEAEYRKSTNAGTSEQISAVLPPPPSVVEQKPSATEHTSELLSKDPSEKQNEQPDVTADLLDTTPYLAVELPFDDDYNSRKIENNEEINHSLHQSFLSRQQSNSILFQQIQSFKESLPIFQSKEEILHLINENQIILICGETGSGKTTQLPFYILENMILSKKGSIANIIVTQPRRIATISIAERVHYEACESSSDGNRWTGGIGNGLVGYQVRLDSKYHPEKTRLLYCTTGVLLRKLQNPQYLSSVSHIILDEIHERGVIYFFPSLLSCYVFFILLSIVSFVFLFRFILPFF
jgi:ABC-type multidrug transport system fused ATPase/permease subunit